MPQEEHKVSEEKEVTWEGWAGTLEEPLGLWREMGGSIPGKGDSNCTETLLSARKSWVSLRGRSLPHMDSELAGGDLSPEGGTSNNQFSGK